MQWLTAIDHKLLDILQKHCRRQRLDQLMAALTHLGDMGFVWLLWAVTLFRNHRMESILLVSSITVCAVVCNLIMKPLFGRSRPFESRDVELLIREPKDRSFPSGHTMASFTAAATLLGLFGGWQGALALALACLIGWTRLYLCVHHPSDVLAGALFGGVVGALCAAFGRGIAAAWAEWTLWFLGF